LTTPPSWSTRNHERQLPACACGRLQPRDEPRHLSRRRVALEEHDAADLSRPDPTEEGRRRSRALHADEQVLTDEL